MAPGENVFDTPDLEGINRKKTARGGPRLVSEGSSILG